MSFDFTWFTTVPGLFITGGVVLLIVALIILIVSGKKSKKEKKAMDANAAAIAAGQATPPLPTDVNVVAGNNPNAPTMGMSPAAPVQGDPLLAAGQPAMPGMPDGSMQQMAAPSPAVAAPAMADAVSMQQQMGMPAQAPVDMTAAVQTTPVTDPSAMYGGASPVQAAAPQTQIYGGADPMANVAQVAPVAPIGAMPGAQGTIPVAPVAPIGGMPQQ